MGYDSKDIKVYNIKPSMNIHDRNDLLFKNRLLHKNYDLPDNKKKFKDHLDEKKKENNDKDTIDISSQNEEKKVHLDSVDIDFLNTIKNNQESMEQQYIACKIACGEYTSKEEIEYLKNSNMDLLKRTIVVNNQRKKLELRLKMVSNKHEAQMLIFRAKDMINKTCVTFNNKELDGGSIKVIMRCAIDKAEKKYLNDNLYDDDLELQINLIEAGVL